MSVSSKSRIDISMLLSVVEVVRLRSLFYTDTGTVSEHLNVIWPGVGLSNLFDFIDAI